jgi:RimJ/RimL family protein N-acetyltransferase
MSLPTFTTPRLILRALKPADALDMQAYAGDFEVSRMLAQVPHPYPVGEAAAFIAEMAVADLSLEPMRVFAIETEGRFAGTIGVTSKTLFREDPVGFGYWLGRPFWGRGLMTEAARAVIGDFVFGVLGRGEIVSGMYTDNHASWRIQEKLGFVRFGEKPKACLARGRPAPHWDTRLTRAMFEEATR